MRISDDRASCLRRYVLLLIALCAGVDAEDGPESAWDSDEDLREFFALAKAHPDGGADLERKRDALIAKTKLVTIAFAFRDARLVAEDRQELQRRGLYRAICWTAGDAGSNRGTLHVPPRLAHHYLCAVWRYEYGEARPLPELVAQIDHHRVRAYAGLKMEARYHAIAPENNPDQRVSPKGTLEQEQEIIRIQDELLSAGILLHVTATIPHGRMRGAYRGQSLRRIGLECGWDWNTFGSGADGGTHLSLKIPNGCVERILADIAS